MQIRLLVFILLIPCSLYSADKLIEKSLTDAVQSHDFATTQFYAEAAQHRSIPIDSQLTLAEELVHIAYQRSKRFGNKHLAVDAAACTALATIAITAAMQPPSLKRDGILNSAALFSAYYFLRTCANSRAQEHLKNKFAILGLLQYLKNKKEKKQ